jgi:hypothetical protein
MDARSVTSSRGVNRLAGPVHDLAFSGERMVAATFQPFFLNNNAVSLPKPLDAPVISTVLAMVIFLLKCD